MEIAADIIEEILKTKKDFERYDLEDNFCLNINAKSVKQNDDRRVIRGLASTSHKDRVEDVIIPSALRKAQDHLMQPGASTVFFNHDRNRPIGKVLKSKFTKGKGLVVEIEFSKASDVDDIWTKVKEGILTSLSIGGRFKRVRIERDSDGKVIAFKVLEIELMEVSVVGIPANPNARITDVSGKSLEGWIQMTKSIKSLTSTVARKEDSKMAKKKTKKEVITDADDDDGDEEILTSENVEKMIDEKISPLVDSMKSLAESTKVLVEKVSDLEKDLFEDDDDEEDNEEDEEEDEVKAAKKTKKTKADKSVPDWAKELTKTVDGLSSKISKIEKGTSKRKGMQLTEEDEDEEGDEEGKAPKKVLKDFADPDTLNYVDYIMNKNPKAFKELDDSEKTKAKQIYMAAMVAAQT